MILIPRFGSVSSCSGSVIELYLILSRASEELEKLSQENFFVGVESIDDQRHQLLDIGVKRENFFRHSKCVF